MSDESYRRWSDEDEQRQERKAKASHGRVRHPQKHTPEWTERQDELEATSDE